MLSAMGSEEMVTEAERSTLAEFGSVHGLWRADDAIEVLARRDENTTFRIGDIVVRRGVDAEAVGREVALLRALADATAVPVPVPLFHAEDLGMFAYRRLPGAPLLQHPLSHDADVTAAIVEVLRALRAVPEAARLPVDDYPEREWHRDAIRDFNAVRSRLSPADADAVATFLAEDPPPARAERMPQHNDLGAEHILVDGRGRVAGIIDWTDAARTDPARDAGSLYRDLGAAVAYRVSESLGHAIGDDERHRIRFYARCRWLEDLAFGVEDPVGRGAYLRNARRTFAHVFGDASG